ncbi:unnamed protein product, partial [Symbiodinium pilosum]
DVLNNVTLLACSEQGHDLCRLTRQQIRASVQGWWVDVSQCITRRARARPGEPLPTLTTATELYSFTDDRVILGCELLSMHGHAASLRIPPSVSDSTVKDLAGEGIALPSLGSVLWCLFLCKRFPKVRREALLVESQSQPSLEVLD